MADVFEEVEGQLRAERYKSVIGLMVGLLALTMKLRVKNGGSSTLNRLSKKKGLEALIIFCSKVKFQIILAK